MPTPRKKSPWPRRLTIALLLYLSLFLLLSCTHTADLLILHPTTDPLDTGIATRELIPVPNATPVELWHASSPALATQPAKAFLLYFTGNADRADRWIASTAQSLADPIEVYGMNYPGFGGSPGPARLASIAPAADAVYDTLRARAGTRPIFLQGNSLGTTAVLHLLATKDPAAATIHNPPPLPQLIFQHHGWWNLWLAATPISLSIPSELDSIKNAQHAKAPALFILSTHDEIVPVDYQRLVYNAYAGPKTLLEFPHTHNTGMDDAAWQKVRTQTDKLWTPLLSPSTRP